MSFPFIDDLDEFFCAKYANYDKICILPGYHMPLMQKTRVDEYGRTRSYTLPASTMALIHQEKKAELLKALKEKLADKTFSFSFHPLSLWQRFTQKFKKDAFYKSFNGLLKKYKVTEEEAVERLTITAEIYQNIVKGKWNPSKNLVLSLALAFGFSFEDTENTLLYLEENFDYSYEKDVVVAYLLQSRTYNIEMVKAALSEYKVANLFLA